MNSVDPLYDETGIGLVGILNITPDSFSDGGQWMDADTAVALAQAMAMVQAGAQTVDIGAESTRPGAEPLSADEEWQRLEAVLTQVIPKVHAAEARVSVDTRHATTAERALALGVDCINDVTGLQDDAMVALARDSQADWVVMHSLGVPADPEQRLPEDADPLMSVRNWAGMTIDRLTREGVAKQRIILDPGIGFGKSAEQSLKLIRGVQQLKTLGTRLMVGHSRKSFLQLFTDKPAAERDPESCALSVWLMMQHVDYLRVHNVDAHARTLRVARALHYAK